MESTKDKLVSRIVALVEKCNDLPLLDLIVKLLYKCADD